MSLVMGKGLKFLIGLVLILYFLFLVLSKTPAAWAIWAVQKAVPNAEFSDVSGTLWKGQAAVSQVKLLDGIVPLGQMNWQLKPLSLLMLNPCLDIDLRNQVQSLSGDVCQSIVGGKTRINDMILEGSLAEYKDHLPMKSVGNVSVNIVEASLAKGKVESLDGRMSAQNLKVHTGEAWLVLGDYGGNLSSADGAILADIEDIQAPMKVDMQGAWTAGELTYEGTVQVTNETPDLIKKGLPFVGEEIAAGKYKLQQ